MGDRTDHVKRMMTVDGSFRIIAVSVSATVEEIARAQGAEGDLAEELAQVLVAAVLVRETLAPTKRVQVTLQRPDGSSLVAESSPQGACRGFVNLPGEGEALEPVRLMRVAYHHADGRLHQSTVEVTDAGAVAGAVMEYLQTSAQVIATVGIISHARERLSSVGYAVQLLPDADRRVLATITERLERDQRISPSASAAEVIDEIAGDLSLAPLVELDLRFECGCSRDRVLATMSGLAGDDILALIAEGKSSEVRCDGCSTVYEITVSELTEMMHASGLLSS